MVRRKVHKILGQVSKDFVIQGLCREDMRELTEDALNEAGRQNKRACALKPILIVWLVIGMGLYRRLSIAKVFERMMFWVREIEPGLIRHSVTPEAVVHARSRLGAVPLKILHREVIRRGEPVAATFHDFRVWGIDGSEFTLPDTRPNEAVFGRHESDRGPGAYPQLRGLFLVGVATHQVQNCCLMPCTSSEASGLPFLLKDLGSKDLVLLDRGLTSFAVFLNCQRSQVHFVVRISSTWKPKLVQRLGKGDALMEFKACGAARTKLPPDQRNVRLVLRVLEFQVGDGERVRLVTDLLDPKQYSALELARLYHQRWECELAYKELKIELLSIVDGRQKTHFRSKS